MTTFLDLDSDSIRTIALQLRPRDFFSLSLVSKGLNQKFNKDEFWQELIRKDFPIFETRKWDLTWKDYYKILAGYIMPQIYDGFTVFQMLSILELMQSVIFYSEKKETFQMHHSTYLQFVAEMGMRKYLNSKEELNWRIFEQPTQLFEDKSLETLYLLKEDSQSIRAIIYDKLHLFIKLFFFRPFLIKIDPKRFEIYLEIIFPYGQSKCIDCRSDNYNNLFIALYKGFLVTDRNSPPTREIYLQQYNLEKESELKRSVAYYNNNDRRLIGYMQKLFIPSLRIKHYLENEEEVFRIIDDISVKTFGRYPKHYTDYLIRQHIRKIKESFSTLMDGKNDESHPYKEILKELKKLKGKAMETEDKMKALKKCSQEQKITKQELYLIIKWQKELKLQKN